MNKKTLIIIIAVVVLLAVVAAVFYVFVSRPPKVEVEPEEAALTEEEKARLILTDEEIEKGVIMEDKIARIEKERLEALREGEVIEPIEIEKATVKSIVGKEVLAPTLSADRQSLFYYDEAEGELYMSDLDGSNQRAITSANFENVWGVKWSANKDKAVITFSEDGEDKQYALFDLKTQEVIEYDKKYQGVTLAPNGDKIAYLYRDDEKQLSNISVADPDTKNYTKLLSYPDPDVNLDWFENDYVAFTPTSTGYEEGEVGVAGKDGESLRVIVGEKYGVSTKYSPDGSKFIFTQADAKNPRVLKLNIIDSQGLSNAQYLNVDTLADKCAWSYDNQTVYCGVPDFYVGSYIMPNDYYNGKFITTDSFYKIDTETQSAELIISANNLGAAHDVYDPSLSSDGKVFYFTDRQDNQLHALTIP